ncbi:TetR/AcrR family transcriptional regulator [Cryptosporangium arvum]|uniref:TetR/AcrR family transcriptional regulator n=1 Tax=Cryptosporangium arvum TaxID=80871 RepID=UPI0004AD2304|nr:TetR family transcriptional regulator C-terminal domain-containing protein [Cryptosporangium arvum]
MPRTADHEQNRRTLSRATWDLIAGGGMEAVSLRTVAARAGVSMGRVQYYFKTKDDLLLYALEDAHVRMSARIDARISDDDPRTALLAVLEELLGGDAETRDAIRVHLAFAARAQENERLAAVLVEGDDELLALAVRVVGLARDAGADVDPELDGQALWVLARGLGVDVALYRLPIERARAVLAHAVGRLAPLVG